jgi:small conductance mechanosensitive channel
MYELMLLAQQATDTGASGEGAEFWTKKVEQYLPTVIGALIFLVVAWIVAGWVSALVTRAMQRANVDLTLTRFCGKMAAWVVRIIAVISALGMFGIESTSFAALIGGAGLAVGLAFQGTLGSFAAGIMLLVFRPFKVGDVVSAAGVTAKVYEIGMFTTTLDTPDNRRFIVPNGAIFGSTIENISHHAQRRVDVAVGVDYSADIDATRDVLAKSIQGVEGVLADPESAIVLTGLGASSVDWVVRVWVESADFFAVKERVTRSVKMHLDEAGIGIPFPQMDVHLDHRPAT